MTVETTGAASPVQPADAATTLVPPNPVAAANAELTGLVNNKEWAAKFFAGDVEARATFDGLTRAIAAADDLAAALAGTAVAPPLIETIANGELPARALASTVEQMRSFGLNDATIREAVAGEPVTKQEVEMAKRYQQMKHSDADWVARLLKGDFQAKKEQLLLSIILTNPVKA